MSKPDFQSPVDIADHLKMISAMAHEAKDDRVSAITEVAIARLATCDLSNIQSRIGYWALRTFGTTPPAVHAARMDREMADVHDCVAIGDVDTLGRALAGVIVVTLALADSCDIDLTASLLAEQDDNEASRWIQTSWGQWQRAGDGSVPDDGISHRISVLTARGHFTPQEGCRLLRDRGASLNAAIAFLVDSGVASTHFEADSPADLSLQDIEDLKSRRIEQCRTPKIRLFKDMFDNPTGEYSGIPRLGITFINHPGTGS